VPQRHPRRAHHGEESCLFRDLPGHIGGLDIRGEHRMRAGFAMAQPGRDSDGHNTI
jgi:hypothetical protein